MTKRKAKKSYTLSPDSVRFLDCLRERRQASSVSAVLEDIVQAARREYERETIEKAVAGFYSGLDERERREQEGWGEFALSQFPDSEED